MKKLLSSMLIAVVLVASGFTQQAVHAADPNVVEGVINEGGNPVDGANVLVKYGAATIGSATTDSNGHFVAPITSPPPVGSQITVSASKGSSLGAITISFKLGKITITITIVIGTPIPEYGTIGTIAAAGLGLGAFMYARRRVTSVGRLI